MARIMGNKTLEKDLRSKNLGGLHTDVCSEEDYAFLARLEHRPCTATHYTPPYREISQKREKRMISRDRDNETSSPVNQFHSSVGNRLRSAPGNMLRSSTTIGLTNKPGPIINDIKKSSGSQLVCSKRPPTQQTNLKGNAKDQAQGSETKPSQSNDTTKSKERPKTVTIVTHDKEPTPIPSPRQFSRRASRAADFFEEDKKIDVVELRLKAARALDYSDRVAGFCEELEEMASGQPQVDWYSLRLHSGEPVKKDLGLANIVEETDSRYVGNLNVRSMTVPQLDLNFD